MYIYHILYHVSCIYHVYMDMDIFIYIYIYIYMYIVLYSEYISLYIIYMVFKTKGQHH